MTEAKPKRRLTAVVMWTNVVLGAVAFVIISRLDGRLEVRAENIAWAWFFGLLFAASIVSASLAFRRPILTALCLVAPQPILIFTVCPGNLALVTTFFSLVLVTLGGILGWCLGGSVHLIKRKLRKQESSNHEVDRIPHSAPSAP